MKYAICSKVTKEIATIYDSDKPEQGTNRFGGPWDDSNKFEHLEIPEELLNEPSYNLESTNGQKLIGFNVVPVLNQDGTPKMIQVKDEEGNNVKDLQGNNVIIQDTREEPIYQPCRTLKIKQ